jgi:hypothetical protein
MGGKIKIFEGPRNSGKTFLARKYSEVHNLPIYKFDFVGWFNRLQLDNESSETHSFALGKELMLLQLSRDGLLPDFILDRGIITVLSWGILSSRITEEFAHNQLKMIAEQGLLDNCEIYFVTGDNPDKSPRNKDNWDFTEQDNKELEIVENLIGCIQNQPYNVYVHRIFNSFTNKTINDLKHI